MSNGQVYARVEELERYSRMIKEFETRTVEAGSHLGELFAQLAWEDDIYDKSFELYASIVDLLNNLLGCVDSNKKIMDEQIKCLYAYCNISV